jgi:hypothetical protein
MNMERSVKRLAILLVASLVVIMVAKVLLSKAITSVGTAAAEKKRQANAAQLTLPVSAIAATSAPEAVSGIPAIGGAADGAVPAAEVAPASSPADPPAAN